MMVSFSMLVSHFHGKPSFLKDSLQLTLAFPFLEEVEEYEDAPETLVPRTWLQERRRNRPEFNCLQEG
jgi:hypothetical protein